FAGGKNPPGAGTTSDIYDLDAAVGPQGELRPLYGVQQRVARFVGEHAWLAGAERVADFQVGLDYETQRARKYLNDPTGLQLPPEAAEGLLYHGVLTSAFCAGLSPALADLYCDDLLACTGLPLAVVTWDALAEDVQKRLVRFVRGGGKLLLVGVLPTMDENFRPCTILRDLVGCQGQTLWKPALPRLNAFGVENVYVNGGLWEMTGLPADAEVIAEEVRQGRHVIGLRCAVAGGGTIAVLGFQWMHGMHEHATMIRNGLAHLGLVPQVESSNQNLWTSLRRDGERSMLFVLNLFSSPMEGEFKFRDGLTGQWVEVGKVSMPPMRVRAWCAGQWYDPVEG
ncbi:MAG: hypothetical protein WCI73_18450, partial [Phycisphaerae bacterium]